MINFFYSKTAFFIKSLLLILSLFFVWSCEDDDDEISNPPTEGAVTYILSQVNSSLISGYVIFYEDGGTLMARIQLAGTRDENTYPAHLHGNTAAEGGSIEIDFEPVNGVNGMSTTSIPNLSIEDIEAYDGYIDIHMSESDETIVAQTDIGVNELTGNSQTFDLASLTTDSISGSILFEERVNGFTKATITLENTDEGGLHPAHIHQNTAAEGGAIAISFNAIDGATGMSVTNIRAFDGENGEAVTYEDLLNYDGYVNVHLSAENLGTVVAQADIGQNAFTDNTISYDLDERQVAGISGSITFTERVNSEVLATIVLDGTSEGGTHPAHIHQNTFVEGGQIVLSFTPIDGATGISKTNVTAFDNGDSISFELLQNYDGYVNVHLSAESLGTIVAQGDIGANALTGESVAYRLDERSETGISGTATLFQRQSGKSLMVVALDGTPEGGSHPSHIHQNTAAEGGPIAISLTNINGTTGQSMTTIRQFDDGSPVTYTELIEYDGYINVHLSANALGTVVSQGDMGQNALSGDSTVYPLTAIDGSGVSGTATFFARNNGYTLVEIMLDGTTALGDHPAHIHFNSAAEGGGIAIDLANIDGATGISRTSVVAQNNNKSITYEQLLEFDGYINVHQSALDLATILAQGNIGINYSEESE